MNKLDSMVKLIKESKELYYNTGRSTLTDAEYDKLVEEAAKLGYKETVGANPVDSINKIEHEHKMLSLDKCHTAKEVSDFIGNKHAVAMWKADGLTISCTYQDGELIRLETRGNGETGNDIMFHADSIENLPKHINKPGKYVIDGECVILWSDFETINSALPENDRYSHPRNLAAGSLNLLDPNISKKRHLQFYAWDVIEGGSSNLLHLNLNGAKHLGFDIVDMCAEALDESSDLEFVLNSLRESAKQQMFPIDGVVIKYNDIKYGKSLGATEHHFRNAVAYKFEDDRYPTKLKSVTWQVGKTGIITPVANFEPVDVAGVEVEKASLHNISIMKQLGLTNGCTVYTYRANDVIPQIDYADNDGNGEVEIPSVCPVCGQPTKIVKENDSEVLMCTNDSCPGKVLGKWETFVSKKAMDIDGLSRQTLETFLNCGYITEVFDTIYDLADYKRHLYNLIGFGKKSIDNILAAIEKSKDVDLQHFIVAFSIPGIGEGQSKIIAKRFPTFEEFRDACDCGFRFDKLDGIGVVLNANIHQWWVNNNWQMVDVAQRVRFKNDFMNAPTGTGALLGKTFVVTGTVNHFKNRKELQDEIESLGGHVVGSVSKNTDYLINNDVNSTSGKNKKAKELGVAIISEQDFIDMIGGHAWM